MELKKVLPETKKGYSKGSPFRFWIAPFFPKSVLLQKSQIILKGMIQPLPPGIVHAKIKVILNTGSDLIKWSNVEVKRQPKPGSTDLTTASHWFRIEAYSCHFKGLPLSLGVDS